MAFSYPQDTEEFQKERRSYQTLFYKFDMAEWAPNGSDNTDHGMDYGFEYIENKEYRGYRVLSQIKSTEHLKKLYLLISLLTYLYKPLGDSRIYG